MAKANVLKIETKTMSLPEVMELLIKYKVLAGVQTFENSAAVYHVAAKGVNKRTIQKAARDSRCERRKE